MSNTRRRSRETSNGDSDFPSRIVAPRRSTFSEDPDPTDHTNHVEETESSEETRPTRSRSSTAVPPTVFSSPIIPSSPILNFLSATRRRANPPRWDWMPKILKKWRREEQIPKLPEPPTPIPPLTQEPVHHTIPVLITRLATHEDRLDRLDHAMNDRIDLPTSEVELLQHQVSVLENDLAELRDVMIEAHNEGVEEVMLLRQQLTESRNQMTEMSQEIAAIRTERAQLRADAEASARMADLLGNMDQYLR